MKNNLQVVASLLNIHGRSAGTPEAQAAYAGISRRVGALSIVHRNHFAEMEENRGISLRPLVTELAAELRASTPESARGLAIELEIDTPQHDPGCCGRGRLPDHRDRRICDPSRAPRAGRDIPPPHERADRAPGAQQPGLVPDEDGDSEKVAVRADRRGPGQAAPIDTRTQAWPLQRRFARISADLTRRKIVTESTKKSLQARNPFANKTRCIVRIVTFCPPALAIRLNGPGTANPPPPGGASGPSSVWGHRYSRV